MKKKVVFIELTVLPGMLPLASGYMEAVCRKDSMLTESFQFEKISLPVKTSDDQILSFLQQQEADVYAFSCYVWNTGKVRRLLKSLRASHPRAHFMLGGPQVMHQAVKYLSPEEENVFICNGEGERTFANFLRVMLSSERDFSTVRGLSFYRDRQLVATEAEHRIANLSEIPSPFLEGVFEKGKYSWMVIETNRGCPFKCNYCYWGSGAIGQKVYQYDETRVEQELEWISKSQCSYLFLADANWGMLKRDVDLSRHIVDCHNHYGAPIWMHFCSSKNTPERVAEITRIFHEAGMITSQSVSLQTISPEALKRVERDNIKTSAYLQMQQSFQQHDISSFIEMIWPLPGETLNSFQEGLGQLCELGAESFYVYQLLLMNNVGLVEKEEEYGIVTVSDSDPDSEAELVVQTREIDMDAYKEGLRYVYVVTCLHMLHGLRNLARYLYSRGIMRYADLFRTFKEFCWNRPAHPFTSFCERDVQSLDAVKYTGTGAFIHLVLHSQREMFDELLEEFVSSQAFWRDSLARFYFEVDLLNRLHIYRNTPVAPKRRRFSELSVSNVLPTGYVVDVPSRYLENLREYIAVEEDERSANCFTVNYRRMQLPFGPYKTRDEHFHYCFDMLQRTRDLTPTWRARVSGTSLRSPLSSAGSEFASH
jgi:radical SAM superfamily enzyme YgiQ (UPF0313 family)